MSRTTRRYRLPEPLVASLLLACLVTVGQAAVPVSALAAGPAITITDPAPGTTLTVGSRFRLGWVEKPASGAPIIKRAVAQYTASAPGGGCAKASHALAWTNTSANRPFRYPLKGLAAGSCYYWTVTLTDIYGYSTKARSGYVSRPPASDPGLDVLFPVPGAFTDAPPVASYTLKWSEAASAGVVERTVAEESAPMASGRSCTGVTWAPSRSLTADGGVVAVTDLASGFCYRYTITVTDAGGATASAASGPLLITNAPPPCAYGDPWTFHRAYGDWQRTPLDRRTASRRPTLPSTSSTRVASTT